MKTNRKNYEKDIPVIKAKERTRNVRAQQHTIMNIVFVYKCITLVEFTFSEKMRNALKEM